jgi:hypothetical protein
MVKPHQSMLANLLQCGEASANNTLKLRMFPLSLSGIAFTWFTSLAPNSIFTWAQLEQKFHEYFYSGNIELRLSHLTAVSKSIMSLPPSILGDLETLGTDALT